MSQNFRRIDKYIESIKLFTELWIPVICLGVTLGVFVNIIFSTKFFFKLTKAFNINQYFLVTILINVSICFIVYYHLQLIYFLRGVIRDIKGFSYSKSYIQIMKIYVYLKKSILKIVLFLSFFLLLVIIREPSLFVSAKEINVIWSCSFLGIISFFSILIPILLPLCILINHFKKLKSIITFQIYEEDIQSGPLT